MIRTIRSATARITCNTYYTSIRITQPRSIPIQAILFLSPFRYDMKDFDFEQKEKPVEPETTAEPAAEDENENIVGKIAQLIR